MCIIIHKMRGVDLPSDEILRVCFTNNPDGAGFMYRNSRGAIIIHKGFMEIDDLLDALHRLPDVKNIDLGIHFRWATHGDKTSGNTHPFPITKRVNRLRRLRTACDYALMHNGVCYGLNHKDKTLSDTMCLVKILSYSPEFSFRVQQLLLGGKFLIMDTYETRRYGSFIYHEGCYYSNDGFRPVIVNYLRGEYDEADLLGVEYDNSIGEDELLELKWYNEYYGTRYRSYQEMIEDLSYPDSPLHDDELDEYETWIMRQCRKKRGDWKNQQWHDDLFSLLE